MLLLHLIPRDSCFEPPRGLLGCPRAIDSRSIPWCIKVDYKSIDLPQVNYDKDEEELKCLRAMCDAEYAMREKKCNVYHMGLVTRQGRIV